MRRGSKPQRDPGRLHRLVNHRQQLGGEGIEVNLLAQPGGERLDRVGRVVSAPVEAAVNHLLDAAAGRLEQAAARVAAATAQFGGLVAMPPDNCTKTRTTPA